MKGKTMTKQLKGTIAIFASSATVSILAPKLLKTESKNDPSLTREAGVAMAVAGACVAIGHVLREKFEIDGANRFANLV